MPKLIIRNGRVIDPASGLDAVRDVAIEDGQIAAIGENLRRHRRGTSSTPPG